MVEIGHFNKDKYPAGLYGLTGQQLDERYQIIRTTQQELCQTEPRLHLAASFSEHMLEMKDEFHYHQSAYNTVGKQAASFIADFFENASC